MQKSNFTMDGHFVQEIYFEAVTNRVFLCLIHRVIVIRFEHLTIGVFAICYGVFLPVTVFFLSEGHLVNFQITRAGVSGY